MGVVFIGGGCAPFHPFPRLPASGNSRGHAKRGAKIKGGSTKDTKKHERAAKEGLGVTKHPAVDGQPAASLGRRLVPAHGGHERSDFAEAEGRHVVVDALVLALGDAVGFRLVRLFRGSSSCRKPKLGNHERDQIDETLFGLSCLFVSFVDPSLRRATPDACNARLPLGALRTKLGRLSTPTGPAHERIDSPPSLHRAAPRRARCTAGAGPAGSAPHSHPAAHPAGFQAHAAGRSHPRLPGRRDRPGQWAFLAGRAAQDGGRTPHFHGGQPARHGERAGVAVAAAGRAQYRPGRDARAFVRPGPWRHVDEGKSRTLATVSGPHGGQPAGALRSPTIPGT